MEYSLTEDRRPDYAVLLRLNPYSNGILSDIKKVKNKAIQFAS